MTYKQHLREIAGKTFIIQSCGLDRDLDIVGNVGIGIKGRCLHYQHIQISGDKITYPYFSPYKAHREQMTHQEFDAYLNENFKEIMEMIIDLLEPHERQILVKLLLPQQLRMKI